MNKLVDKKHINTMIFLCTITYFVSYITRINYAAVILEIVNAEGISKSTASIVTTGSFITYAAGQLVSGYLGDKIKPRILIFIGLLASSIMNMLIPLCRGIEYMIIVWCINGFAQAMLWPPMVKIITNLLEEDDSKRAFVRMSWGSSFGTITVYLLSPACIVISGWKTVFLFSAIMGIIMAVTWIIVCRRMEYYAGECHVPDDTQTQQIEFENVRLAITPQLVVALSLIMLGIVFQGILRDGVATWMPSYISETFNLSSYISILTGVVLPIFAILCIQIASWLYRKVFTNELLCAAWMFGIGFIAAAILSVTSSKSAILSVILSAIITGCMHGVNVILICMVPPRFIKYGNVSMISGILNFCTYVGSALSTYGFAIMSEKLGWGLTVVSWSIIAFMGTLVCSLNIKRWKSFCCEE